MAADAMLNRELAEFVVVRRVAHIATPDRSPDGLTFARQSRSARWVRPGYRRRRVRAGLYRTGG